MKSGEIAANRAFNGRMACRHDGYHSVRSLYDRRRGLLIYFWTCERCGVRLDEVRREDYRPAYDPRGNERALAAGGR
jgi:hypothetical protein